MPSWHLSSTEFSVSLHTLTKYILVFITHNILHKCTLLSHLYIMTIYESPNKSTNMHVTNTCSPISMLLNKPTVFALLTATLAHNIFGAIWTTYPGTATLTKNEHVLCSISKLSTPFLKTMHLTVNCPGGVVTFTKIVCGCACRTSKIWLSLYQFFA